MVEQRPFKAWVLGSNPSELTISLSQWPYPENPHAVELRIRPLAHFYQWYKVWVPHPRRGFVFAARVGYLNINWRNALAFNRRQRQREAEGCAVAQFALGPDASAVRQHNVFDNGQSQPRAARLARTRLVDAVKTLEDALEVLGGDAGTEILHAEFDLRVQKPRAHQNAFAADGVVQRVFNQVAKDLIHRVRDRPEPAPPARR